MKQQPSKLVMPVLVTFICLVLTACSHTIIKQKGIVQPLESQSVRGHRQRVDLHWMRRDKLERVIISTTEAFEAHSEQEGWVAEDEMGGRIQRFSDGQLFIYYLGKMIFSPAETFGYDYISFIDVCEGPDGLDRLQFQMLMGGTANADIDDRLFLYYDESSKDFEYEVVENRYLQDSCSLEKAIEMAGQTDKERQLLQALFGQLRPTEGETFIDEYSCSAKGLPTKKLLKTEVETLLEKVSAFAPVEVEESEVSDSEDDYSGAFLPDIAIEELAENDLWRIVAVSYLEIWESWGVLLAESKATGEWTAFYNIPSGGSKVLLYLSEDLELVNNALRGSFCVDCSGWGNFDNFEITLDDFTVQRTHGYRFVDYPVESVYDGPVAALKVKSHEMAQVFPTRIRQQLAGGANFAGHYSVMEAGCGTECQIIVITDVVTGNVMGALTARAGAEFELDSQLIIIDSSPFCVSEGLCEPAYYELESGKLIQLGNSW